MKKDEQLIKEQNKSIEKWCKENKKQAWKQYRFFIFSLFISLATLVCQHFFNLGINRWIEGFLVFVFLISLIVLKSFAEMYFNNPEVDLNLSESNTFQMQQAKLDSTQKMLIILSYILSSISFVYMIIFEGNIKPKSYYLSFLVISGVIGLIFSFTYILKLFPILKIESKENFSRLDVFAALGISSFIITYVSIILILGNIKEPKEIFYAKKEIFNSEIGIAYEDKYFPLSIYDKFRFNNSDSIKVEIVPLFLNLQYLKTSDVTKK